MVKLKVKLTNNADEADISSLIGNDSIFAIPFFQRPYKWMPNKLTQLNADILALVDEETDVHFLGAVIIHGLASKPAEAQVYEVIDGQQRLTTLYLYMCAVVRLLLEEDEPEEAAGLFRKFLVTSITTNARSNLTLQPCKEDQADLNAVIREILGTKSFGKNLAFTFIPLPGTVEKKGRIAANYILTKRFLRSQLQEGGLERVRSIYTCLLQRVSVVQIDVQDPTNGPKIFDSLNSRQEPMTIGDLVRNDVFARAAIDDPDEATLIDVHDWQPFYESFKAEGKNYFDDYFFPFGLVHDPNLRKSEVYISLKKQWDGKNPKEVINELSVYQDAFLDLVLGGNRCELPVEVAMRVERLRLAKLPSSTFPFLMRLVVAFQNDEVGVDEACEVLNTLDSFLTRRALCGQEPTGLHAVFKRLWQDCDGEITAAKVRDVIRGHKTVSWPTSEEVISSIATRPAYKSAITKYVLLQYEEFLGGDKAQIDPWIEHVLPTAHSNDWADYSPLQHSEMKDLLANLIPLSSEMNSSLGNRSYEVKSKRYAEDSAFKTARKFAEVYEHWTPNDLVNRSALLGAWAVQRWSD